MQLFRIGPDRYINDLAGRGGSYKNGARWNLSGQPALYFGTSAAVAMLEMGNYIPSPKLVPKGYVLGTFDVASTAIETVELTDLPDDWDQFPYPKCTQQLGSAFLARNQNLILLVPSCAAAGLDQIAVVNPLHPDISTITLVDTNDQIYNTRLFKGLGKG
ncbi:RES family NAD+ phosphorylase [Halomonas heilongjiangensis]|uniref:RES domain-containing protein n=1 Tax=Halomonas heilongjiangensis TaxID=1387883 RepID=A0A2N7TU68_9GAMM|nr:RES family NAD+ phosphorylase [Halomonas heilongjiangensis]PMR71742.1 RES domain-containing protein [Halomonas heilongjiangensis]PXX89977.1 hypothetical protein CR158_10365 [Halomonas heilongjiangensis]